MFSTFLEFQEKADRPTAASAARAAAEAAAAAASGDPVAQVKARVEVEWSDLMSPVNIGQKLQVNGYYHMNVEKYKHERNEGSLIT